jgi:hypothetical protein
MLGWFKRKIVKWARSDQQVAEEAMIGSVRSTRNMATSRLRTSSDSDDIQTDEVFTFKVWKAGGGHLVEFRSYDRQKDRSNNRLHIINDSEDFSAELGKIVFMELMRS